jgi:hypothetical protein
MVLGGFFCHWAQAEQSVTLAWNPSPSAGVAGYMVSYGSDGTNYGSQADAGTNTSWTVGGLADGSTTYFEVSAYDVSYNQSPPSAAVEFVAPETVAVLANLAGAGSVSGGGTYIAGSSVTVTATANSGYTFANWTENGVVESASSSYGFTLAANRSLVANFTANPVTNTVTALARPAGAGSVSGAGLFVAGSSVTVTATANSGYTFANWTENGVVQSASSNYGFTLAANRILVANFTANPVTNTVTALAAPAGAGSVSGGGLFATGSSVRVTATANSGYTFANWTENGVVQSVSSSYGFTLAANRSLVANFTANAVLNTNAIPKTNTTTSTNASSSMNSQLTVLVSGNGKVTPNLKGRTLTVGRRYTLLATADAGCVFSGWRSNGAAVAGGPAHSFEMTPGLVLQADFVTNPFTAVAGAYEGLFYDTNDVAQQSSGSCKVNVTSKGSFTARLQVGLQSLAYSGQFTSDGQSFNTIARAGAAPLSVWLQLGLITGGITGQVSGSNWTAELKAATVTGAASNAAPQAGKYTLVIPGASNSTTQPAGDGFGSVTVSGTGNVSFSGILADGTSMTSAAMITGQGLWPFYAPLYAGRGSVIGWLAFDTNGDISGQLNWIKAAQSGARYYEAGFTNSAKVTGSAYRWTNGAPVLGYSSGQITLAGGNLNESIYDQIEIGAQNQGANLTQGKPNFTVSASSGVLTGSVVDPQTGIPVRAL